jgi:hypothetical protein
MCGFDSCYPSHLARSSSGSGRRPLKAEITSSNLVRATTNVKAVGFAGGFFCYAQASDSVGLWAKFRVLSRRGARVADGVRRLASCPGCGVRSKTMRAKVGADGQICGRFSMPLAETGRNAVFNRAESSGPRPLSETLLVKHQVRESRAKPARKTPAIADRIMCDLSQRAAKSTAFLVTSATAAHSSAAGAGPSHQETGHRRARDIGACAGNTLEPSAGQGRGPCAGGQSAVHPRYIAIVVRLPASWRVLRASLLRDGHGRREAGRRGEPGQPACRQPVGQRFGCVSARLLSRAPRTALVAHRAVLDNEHPSAPSS